MLKTAKEKKMRERRKTVKKRRVTRVIARKRKRTRKKRKGVVDNDHAKKKHRMAAMSERSLKEVSEGKPLYDEHISFAQKLLQQQFPMLNGQQSPLLSQNSGFCPVKDDKFITQGRDLYSSSIGGNVQLYGSMFKGGELSSSLQLQLAQIYKTLIKEEDGDEEEGNGYKYLELKVQDCNHIWYSALRRSTSSPFHT